MDPRLLGAFGEHRAARFLRENGYNIYTTNFSAAGGELDIVAEKYNVLCFVEVKTRKQGGMLSPEHAVDYSKQENLRSAAAAYINRYKLTNAFRFDIVEVIVDEGDNLKSINHIENAF